MKDSLKRLIIIMMAISCLSSVVLPTMVVFAGVQYTGNSSMEVSPSKSEAYQMEYAHDNRVSKKSQDDMPPAFEEQSVYYIENGERVYVTPDRYESTSTLVDKNKYDYTYYAIYNLEQGKSYYFSKKTEPLSNRSVTEQTVNTVSNSSSSSSSGGTTPSNVSSTQSSSDASDMGYKNFIPKESGWYRYYYAKGVHTSNQQTDNLIYYYDDVNVSEGVSADFEKTYVATKDGSTVSRKRKERLLC